MAAKVITSHRPTLAALAAAVYGVRPLPPGPDASPTTRLWEPLVKAAKTDPEAGNDALTTVMMMDDESAADLLEDALDHWAAGGAAPEQIADMFKDVGLDGSSHSHPKPDTGLMEGMLRYVPGWEADHELATGVISAVWAGCTACQSRLAPGVVTDRATLAGLAGSVYLTPSHTPLHDSAAAGPAAQAWIEQAHGKAHTSGAEAALRAVTELSEDDAADLLASALDVWATSGAALAGVGLLGSLTDAPPRQRPADPMDALREAGGSVVTLDDLDLGDDIDPYYPAPNYGVTLMHTDTPDGRPMPMLVLYPETEGAGIEDLETRSSDGRQRPPRADRHRAGPAVVRSGPRAAGRAHRRPRPGYRLGPARVPALGTHPPRRARRQPSMLMAKSRHKKAENVRRYFKPSAEAIAEVKCLLAPGESRR
jgi:hypothetical protein